MVAEADTYRTRLAGFGDGWRLVDIYEWPHIAPGTDSRAIQSLYAMNARQGIHAHCRVCGHHPLRNAYIVQRGTERETVGSECLHRVLGEAPAAKVAAAVQSAVGKAVRDWERPHKQAQLAAVEQQVRDAFPAVARRHHLMDDAWLEGIVWRIRSDVNPDITAKEVRAILGAFRWQWTREQVAERQAVREAATAEAVKRWVAG